MALVPLNDAPAHYVHKADYTKLKEENRRLRDEIKKLEYALEQIRSTVVEITG